jgi:hypothetical protein
VAIPNTTWIKIDEEPAAEGEPSGFVLFRLSFIISWIAMAQPVIVPAKRRTWATKARNVVNKMPP